MTVESKAKELVSGLYMPQQEKFAKDIMAAILAAAMGDDAEALKILKDLGKSLLSELRK